MTSQKGFYTFNPRENKFNSTLHFCSTESEIAFALQDSSEAFERYANLEFGARIELLERIKAKLLSHKDAIKEAYLTESGLEKSRFEIEFKRTVFQIELFCDFLKTHFQETRVSQKENLELNTPRLIKKNIPLGPILVIGSSNFPLAYSTIGGDTVAALAAGCTVIVKAHPMHVETSKAVANCIFEAIEELKLPRGIFCHLIDDGYEVATKLICDKRIKGVGFTGSIKGGRSLMNLAASREEPIPVFAEMGSINPVVIFNDSLELNIETWSENLANSVCNDAGQFCTKPGLIFIPNSTEGTIFLKRLEKKILEFKSFHMLHPSILKSYEKLKARRAKTANSPLFEKEGKLEEMQGRQGLLETTPSVLLNNPELYEEVFGPFAIVILYNSEIELKNCLNKLTGQLTMTFLGSENEFKKHSKFIQLATEKAGRIIFNGIPTGVTVCQSMNHGGPYPASSDSRFTAVGTDSIFRFTRSVTYQNFFDYL